MTLKNIATVISIIAVFMVLVKIAVLLALAFAESSTWSVQEWIQQTILHLGQCFFYLVVAYFFWSFREKIQ
mgnify:CR=1 FL=1